MDSIRGIIFDKDGTLFHYGEVWGPIGSRSIMKGLGCFTSLTDEERDGLAWFIEKEIGVDRNGRCWPDGVVFDNRRLPKAILRTVRKALELHISPFRLIRKISQGMRERALTLEEDLPSYDFTPARELLRDLHERGYRIGVVSSDMMGSAEIFLRVMGIGPYVDFIRTSDSRGCRRKPHPDAIEQFCREFSLSPGQVCMVGDTVGDMRFAARGRCGRRIAVLTGSNDLEGLGANSDAVYGSIADLRNDPVLFGRYPSVR